MNLVPANEPWLDQVPGEWKRSRIRNEAVLGPGFSSTPPSPEDLCAVVPMESLSVDGRVDFSTQQNLDAINPGLTLFENGDVLFAKITPCMENGKGAHISQMPTRYAFGSTEFHVLRPRKTADAQFLYYATFNPTFRAYAAENMSGAAGQKRVSSRFIKDTRLFLPPLPEQQLIAAYLDASCAVIDAAVEAKRKQLETLEELRKSNICRAVTKGLDHSVAVKGSGLEWLGVIPSHWAIRRIKDIADLRSGDGIEAEDIAPSGEYPVYGGNGLRGYTSSFTHEGRFALIGRQGALCGNINYADGRFWATEHAVVATLLREYDTLWFGELLRVMNLNQYSNAAAQPGLSVDRIKFLKIPLPSAEEQTHIAKYLEDIILQTQKLSSNLESQITTLTAYRKSLIHECVTGQRRVTEADLKEVKAHG